MEEENQERTWTFRVTPGLEEDAARDIVEQLGETRVQRIVPPEYMSGLVHVYADQPDADFLVDMAQLRSVKGALIPVTLDLRLRADDFTNGRWNAALASAENAWTLAMDRWCSAFAKGSPSREAPVPFRAFLVKRFDKSVHPQLSRALPNSPNIAAMIGSFVVDRFPGCVTVNLTQFQLEVYAQLSTAVCHQETAAGDSHACSLYVGFSIPTNKGFSQWLHDRNRLHYGITAMVPSTAYLLAKLAEIQPADVVVDPCCGSATILIEACKSVQPHAWYIGGELRRDVYKIAHGNVAHAAAKQVDLIHLDARFLCLRENSVDVFLSDLPWGRREGTGGLCQRLYPKLVKRIGKCLRQGGRAYLLTLETNLLKRTLEQVNSPLKLLCTREISIGYTVQLFILQKY